MEEATKTTCYYICDGLYQVVEDTENTRTYVVDSNGSFRQVGLARIYAEGTPMHLEEFNIIVAQRSAKRPSAKPRLSIVPKNG